MKSASLMEHSFMCFQDRFRIFFRIVSGSFQDRLRILSGFFRYSSGFIEDFSRFLEDS